ncbi:MAG: Gfo/Idh/MocA family oxidoreductase [Bacteroidales bacterium]|nr:Gfo/Idh/MocA family oxidoreductase [Bacteroidales bacterium]
MGISNDRRDFIKKAVIGTGVITIVPRHVLGGPGYTAPSDRINFGYIGTGKQSSTLLNSFIGLPEVYVRAASDVDSKKLNRFNEWVNAYYAEHSPGKKFKGIELYGDYREMLERKNIDAVVVAAPDHWHARQSIDAMRSGKDVYCEKPMAHTIKEGRMMVATARKFERVFQTGSMQRSWDDFRKACELVYNGYLGEISKVIVNVGGPAMSCDLPEQSEPEYLDWDAWIGPAVWRPYNEVLSPPIEQDHWPRWRDYMEYGGGILADWGAHMFDIAQWALGMDGSGPVKIVPPDDRDAIRGLKFYYDNGIEMVHEDFGRGWAVRFIGSEGSLDVSRSFLDSSPENIVTHTIGGSDKRLYYSDNHYADFTNSIKERTKPVCDVETGHRSATVCSLGNIGYQLGRELEWDPVLEQFKNDGVANRLRSK